MTEFCVNDGLDTIPPTCASQVLHFFSPGEGYEAGHFFTSIMCAFSCADPIHYGRLLLAFPEYGLAVHIAQDHELGLDALRSIAAQSSGV